MAPVVPCPVLVGRAAELDVLLRALADARQGRGSVVVVTGEAGMGKSRLVQELVAAAEAGGTAVRRGRAVPGASGAAFRPLTEALAPIAPVGAAGDELTPWLPALAGIVPGLPPAPPGVEATAPARGEAVIRLVRAGVLVLEDLHWADPETVAVVEHLTDNLGRSPILCVVTVRSEEPSAARDLSRRVAARRSATVVELGALNDAQVAAMVHSVDEDAGHVDVDRVVKLADGVPFLVEEMAAAPGVPAPFAETVEVRLAELEEADRHVLVAAAAFGRHFDWRLLAPATGRTEAEVVEALERGVAAQLVAVDGDGFRFRHALTAEAVLGSVLPPRRQQAAAGALAALDAAHPRLPADLVLVAAALAERAGQPDRAGRLHLVAGEDALARGALQTAAVALDRAVSLCDPGEGRDRAAERLVEALTLAGRVDDAVAAGSDVVRRLPDARAAAVRLRLAAAAVTASRGELAAAQLAEGRRLVTDAVEPALRAELGVLEGELALQTGDPAAAAEHARAALDLARACAAAEIECAALQLWGRCERRSSLDVAERRFREALAAADAHGLAVWRLRALHEIGTITLLDRSEVDALVEAQAVAEPLGAMATAAILDLEIAAGANGLHDLDGERRHGAAAVRRGTELGLARVVAHGWLHVAGADALAGDAEASAAAAAAARAALPGDPEVDGLLIGSCGIAPAIVAGDLAAALDAATRSTERLRAAAGAPPAHFRAAHPLLLAALGRPGVEAVAAELERAGLAVSGSARGVLTMARAIVAGRSDARRAEVLAIEADRLLRWTPLWQAIGRRLAAGAAAVDRWSVPPAWLDDAEAWLAAHGYPVVAGECRVLRDRRSTTAATPAWARYGITRREADVLALLIEGRSNKEIAGALHLSVRTVEKHVEALLRKTSTRTRTELARVTST